MKALLILFLITPFLLLSQVQKKDSVKSKTHFSPYELTWKKEALIAGSGIGLRLLAEFIPTKELLLSETDANNFTYSDVPWFDRPSVDKFKAELINLSTNMNYYAFIAPLPLFLSSDVRNDFLTIATMFVETRLFAEATPMITKKLFPRYRPYVYSQEFDFETKNGFNDSRSFFSNQSSYIFSSAVFTAKVYNDFFPDNKARYWIWGGALSSATAIAVLRHEIGIHYFSDLFIGAIVGSALGFFIPHLHLISQENNNLSITPTAGTDYFGLNLSMNF